MQLRNWFFFNQDIFVGAAATFGLLRPDCCCGLCDPCNILSRTIYFYKSSVTFLDDDLCGDTPCGGAVRLDPITGGISVVQRDKECRCVQQLVNVASYARDLMFDADF